MKTIKTIAKVALITYIVLSILATLAVNVTDEFDYEILNYKGPLTVVEISAPYDCGGRMIGWTIKQFSPFCNACDVFLWLVEFEVDGDVRFFSDGLWCFGQYFN